MANEENKSVGHCDYYQGYDERGNEEDIAEQDFRTENVDDEVNDSEIDTLKRDLLSEISELEWEFKQTKECLYNERIMQVENKLLQARSGSAPEFQHVVALVEETYKIRLQVAKHRMEFLLEIANKELDNELQIAQCAINEKLLNTEEQIRLRLYESLCKIQIERSVCESVDDVENRKQIASNKSGLDADNDHSLCNSIYLPGPNLEARKKPVTLPPSTPRLIYQLPEEEIRTDIEMILDAVKRHKMIFAMTEMNGGKRIC